MAIPSAPLKPVKAVSPADLVPPATAATVPVAPVAQVADTAPEQFLHTGGFDQAKFAAAFEARKNKHLYFRVRFNAAAVANAWQLIVMMQADSRVIDIRWMAYMLGTAYFEAPAQLTITRSVPSVNKRGKPILRPDGTQAMIDKHIKVWRAMSPGDERHVEDIRRYKAAVKVRRIDFDDVEALCSKDKKKFGSASLLGGAWIVEKDGDEFVVDAAGTQVWQSRKGAIVGAAFKGRTAAEYTAFDGDEHTYAGRGYVQLTWWNNYIAAGVALGRGLELLFAPELANDAQTAYNVMAHGMLTGQGYANKHKISDYVHGKVKNYVKARAIVNGNDKRATFTLVAQLAELFEQMLLQAKM
jgi:hypothetical protein